MMSIVDCAPTKEPRYESLVFSETRFGVVFWKLKIKDSTRGKSHAQMLSFV